MPALPVLDFDHPDIGITVALAAQGRVHAAFITFGQDHPRPRTSLQIKGSLKGGCGPVQPVQFDHNSARIVVAMRHDKGRNIRQSQPRQIGRDPEACRQPVVHRPAPAFILQKILKTGTRRKCPWSDIAILEIQTHLGIALGLVQPAGPDLDLQEQMHFAAQEFLDLNARSLTDLFDGLALVA